jgi:hypothetical protein
VSRFFKEAIADFLKHTPCSEGTHSFLHRLHDDPDRRIDDIWQSLLDSAQQMNSFEERAGFVGCLATVWRFSESANARAQLLKKERHLEKGATHLEKSLAKAITDKKAARKDKLAPVIEVSKWLIEVDKVLAEFRSRLRSTAVLDIRSDRDGSRQRTAFMRVASSCFYEVTGEWHDDWVADLTNVAFPDYEITTDMVISARRGVRSWAWPKQEG